MTITYQPVKCGCCGKVSDNFRQDDYYIRVEPLTGLVEGVCNICVKKEKPNENKTNKDDI